MKKLKHQYKKAVNSTQHDYFWLIYPNVRSSIFKNFSTHQERSFYFMHYIEYKDYPLKIRVARGYLMFGMIFQLMYTKWLKAGSIIPKEFISTIKSMIRNKSGSF